MRRKGKDHNLVFLLVSAVVMIATWVGFEVYRAYTQVKMPEGVEEHLKPLNPVLKLGVLDVIENRSP